MRLLVLALTACSPTIKGDLLVGEERSCSTTGACLEREVRRFDYELDLVVHDARTGDFVGHNEGMLTALGNQALRDAAVAFGPELEGSSCVAVDGDDLVVALDRIDRSYRIQFCATLVDDTFQTLRELALSLREPLALCQSNEYVRIGDCTPIAN
jgi:hypothetical protein